jgi:hypothetical protein
MDANRLGRGEMVAAVSALVLLIVMFLFNWFGYDAGAGGFTASVGLNAWESFGFIDIVLFITILVAIGGALMAANAQSPTLPVAISSLVAGLGVLSVLLILFRIISPPDFGVGDFGLDDAVDISRKIGVFLGLIAAGGITYGGFLAMQEEGTSFRDQGDRLQQRGPTDPPPDSGGTPPPAV